MLERLYGKDGDYLKMYRIDNKWTFASRKDTPVVEGNLKPDAVVIVARDKDGRLLVIREKRPVVGSYIWALPAGLVDKGESVYQAAEREVMEETGMKLMFRPNVDVVYLNSFACPGMTDEQVALITGEVEGELSNDKQEENEDITPYLMHPEDMARARLYDPSTPMSLWLALVLA